MLFPFKLLTSAAFDAVGFGTNAVDHLITVPHYPAFNSKVELTEAVEAPGGEVASTMTGLVRLGHRAAYIGRFGDDAAGETGRRSLAAEGVDIEYCETVPGVRTQIAYILIDPTGERTVIWKRDAGLSYAETEVPLEAAMRGRVLHMTPHDIQACKRLAAEARRRSIVVSIDVDNVFEGIDELLPLVDICIASSDFAAKRFGIREPGAGLEAIVREYGSPVAGVTLGDAGSLFLCAGRTIETRGFGVPGGCADTTGAGDAFRAGFLSGLLMGADIEMSALRANAVAALKCRALGARSALPRPHELDQMLKLV